MSGVIHFELPVDQPDRAVKFYTEVFGWKIEKCEGPMDYWLIATGSEDEPGIGGALTLRSDLSAGTVNTIDVPSVDEAAAKVAAAGGKVVAPKMAIPGVGYLAYCQDTEGNTFGVMQGDPSAK